MPPHVQLFDVLEATERAELLAWAIRNQASFEPARIYEHGGRGGRRVDPDERIALKLREFGPLRPFLEKRLLERLPEIMERTGYRGAPPLSLELELNAYGEGGHFARHIDIPAGPGREPLGEKEGEDRVLSAVYYFYSEPKGFSGGALRLFRFGASQSDQNDPEDILIYEPQQNSLIAFPSWVSHEVEHVSCPSGQFEHYRFALNCWFCARVRT